MSEQSRYLVLTSTIPVRWGDLDALGHVNSSRYFTYFETARVHFLEQLGESVIMKEQGPVIVNAQCNFRKQIWYPANLLIKLYIAEPGRTSFMTYYEISLETDPDTLYADGSSKVVWVDYKKAKAVALPKVVVELFNNPTD